MINDIVFRVLQASLVTNESISFPDWQPVFEEMKQQTVAALPYNILPADATKWRSYCMKKWRQAVIILYAQNELISLLESNGISCVILKGTAAAMYYPYPMLRSMGDVDFLVKRGELERAAKLLEENGYMLTHDKDRESHHYAYSKNKISFELHWRLPILSKDDEERLSFFEEGIDRRKWHEIDRYRFPTFPTLHNGLVLIFHINQHLREGLGLRQIIDWMMYVDKLDNSQWEELLKLLKIVGMEQLALTTTAMCQRYLGLRQDFHGCETVDPELCDELMSYIMEKGNFGRKSGETGKIASVFFDISSPIRAFRRLQAGGMCRWDAAKKHPILRPFAWIYQIGFIARELIRNRIRPGDLIEQHSRGLRQRKLIEDLGLRVDRTIRVE